MQAGSVLARFPTDQATRETVERVVREYVASLQVRPDDFRRHLNLVVLYSDRGQLQESIAEYQMALRQRRDFAQPLVNASVVYNRMGKDNKPEEALRRAIQIDSVN